MRLDRYTTGGFDRGAPRWKEGLWLLAGLLVQGPVPGSGWRAAILRLFGAQIGRGVVIKPGVTVKFPWRLSVGDHSWLGERAWIDNLAPVTIGAHCCISQGAYLSTGSHDWSRDGFDLITRPITVADHVWIAGRAVIGPGVSVGEGAILTLGSAATSDLAPWTVHRGVPAVATRPRTKAATPVSPETVETP